MATGGNRWRQVAWPVASSSPLPGPGDRQEDVLLPRRALGSRADACDVACPATLPTLVNAVSWVDPGPWMVAQRQRWQGTMFLAANSHVRGLLRS
eukprot:357286-Chlamydomonas_euryale.AAC.16